MEISVAVLIDGEVKELNSDLQTLLQNVIDSYVKGNVLGIKVKKEKKIKEKKIKDPNAPKREKRPKISAEEEEQILTEAMLLKDKTLNGAADIISKQMKRAWVTIYSRLRKHAKQGTLTFAPPIRNYIPKGLTAETYKPNA